MRGILQTLLVLGACWALVGCGGGGESSASAVTRGKASISITWPDRTRIIPDGADNIRVTLTSLARLPDGVTPLTEVEQTFARPAPASPTTLVHTFNGLPVGRYTATAIAFSGANPADLVATPTANAEFEIRVGETSTFTVTLESVIDSLTVTGTTTLQPGQSSTLTAQAKNASNQNVLVLPANVVWRSNDPRVVFINSGTGAVIGTEATGLSVTVLANGTSASATVTASLRPNRESNQHFEDAKAVTVSAQAFGATAAVGASLGTQPLVDAPATRPSGLFSAAGGFTFDLSQSGGTANVATNSVGITGGNITFSQTNVGAIGSLDTSVAELDGVLGMGVNSDAQMFILERKYSVVGGSVVPGDATLARFARQGNNWSQEVPNPGPPNPEPDIVVTPGAFALFDGSGDDEVFILDATGNLSRYSGTDLSSLGTSNLSSFLTGTVVADAAIAASSDKRVYVAAPLTGGASSKVVAINLTGAPAAVSLTNTPTLPGVVTDVAVNLNHIFTISHVNGVFRLSAFRRSSGVFVADAALAPTANPFVPYRIEATAAGKVFVLGAEITGGNTYTFRVFEVTLS